ncbi:MAG: hypothetical protein ACLQAH_02690 [Limisphaerales bacterium]
MKLNLKQDNTRCTGLQLNPVRFEFTDSTATTVSAAGRFNDWHPVTKPMHPSGNGRWRVSCKLLLFCLFFTTACARGGPIAIGYTNCMAVTHYPQSLMDQIGQLKWYFAHASVGEYMMDGIAALHATNASFYQISGVSAATNPPAVTEAGVIYDFDRGNPGWWQKFDLFQSCVSNGWRYPLVNIAMNKLCFIDADAILDWCTDYVSTLESAFPETMFVYMTMPLTTYQDSDNYARNVYNDGMRDWCRTNNRVLFDVADIEAHDTNGVLCTYVYSDRVCQYLWPGYNASGDGGHPDSPYAQQLLASGFYALAGALMSVDRDGDGVSDGQELIAGTRPLDAQSVFKLVSPTTAVPGAIVLQWNSSSNRFYTLQRGTSLMAPVSFTNLQVDAPATPPMNTCTDSPPKTGSFFYRVTVRQ